MNKKTAVILAKFAVGITAVFLLCLGMYKAFLLADHHAENREIKRHKTTTRLSATERELLHEGDFILRRGFGYFSDFIAGNLNDGKKDVTHAGILVKQNGKWCVIHALSSDVSEIDGMQLQPLNDFLHYSAPGKIIVTRSKHASATVGKAIAIRAQVYLNKHIPFDHSGTIDNDSALFCTELIWQILEKDLHRVTLPNTAYERKAFFHSMQPMYSTKYFDIVIDQYQK
ncbi:YiiX/YebB-like N1pC/P60 family cysteine hydrolase [Flavobacterium sp. RNTU_13]|uniref:YiiX/YebB-like N1pC/P60 family cysteine hydrolase n=1 Tax=Flavobacterium sp. RNTU_13 TaxID=3375145 RepID=UPI0039887489